VDEEPPAVAAAARKHELGSLVARGEPRSSDRRRTVRGAAILAAGAALFAISAWGFTAAGPAAPLGLILGVYGLAAILMGWAGAPTYYLYSGGLVRSSRSGVLFIAWREVKEITTRSATRFTGIVTYRLEISPAARRERRSAMSLSVLPGPLRNRDEFLDQFLRVLREYGFPGL
jgi:hypothetical protein